MEKTYINKKTGAIISENMLLLLEDKHNYELYEKPNNDYVVIDAVQAEQFKEYYWFQKYSIPFMKDGESLYLIPKQYL